MQFSNEKSFNVKYFLILRIKINAITKTKFITINSNDINDNINKRVNFFLNSSKTSRDRRLLSTLSPRF